MTFFKAIIKKRSKDETLKLLAINKMKEFGSFQYTIDRIKCLDTQLEQLIEALGGNPVLSKLLDVLRDV